MLTAQWLHDHLEHPYRWNIVVLLLDISESTTFRVLPTSFFLHELPGLEALPIHSFQSRMHKCQEKSDSPVIAAKVVANKMNTEWRKVRISFPYFVVLADKYVTALSTGDFDMVAA
jgi:hypothetical protein